MSDLFRPLSENEIQNSILEFLKFKKITAWRNNNGGTFDVSSQKFRSKNKWETLHGSPVDILGVLPDGKFLAIEVKKNSKGKPSKGQKTFLEAINRAGGCGFIAYSLTCIKQNLSNYL